jgi:hypothetical protein
MSVLTEHHVSTTRIAGRQKGKLCSLQGALAALREQYANLEDAHSTIARTSSQALAVQKYQNSMLSRQVAALSSHRNRTNGKTLPKIIDN